MRRRLLFIALAAVAFAAGVAAFAGWRKIHQRLYPPSYRSLHGQAQRARDAGTAKIEYDVTICSSDMQSFADGLRRYSLVVARPVAKEVIANPDDDIDTWYKLQLLETLTPSKKESGLTLVAQARMSPGFLETFTTRQESSQKYTYPNLPKTLRPLADNEFVMLIPGGVATVEGVEIAEWHRGYRHFILGDTYMLFIENGPQPGVIELRRQFNDTVVKIIASDKLEVRGGANVDGSDEKELQDELERYCGSSLAQLRRELPLLNQIK